MGKQDRCSIDHDRSNEEMEIGKMAEFNWKTERVAVTGGAGFIGSHLVDRIVALKTTDYGVCVNPPVVVDNFSRGVVSNVHYCAKINNVDLAEKPPSCNCVNAAVVFHLAAKVTGIHYNMSHHLDMMNSNLRINTNLSQTLRLSHPKFLVWVSTACVYPSNAQVPTPESAAAVCNPEPTNFGYGVAKWVGEQQAYYLSQEYGIPTLVVRFFNAFGPRDYYDRETSHVAPALIRRVMEGDDPLVVWGSGDQTRALVDARDIAKCLTALVERLIVDENFKFGEVNIGHASEVSIRELANTITDRVAVALCQCKPGIVFDTSKPDGYSRRAADTSKLHDLIGFIPSTPLVETIDDMLVDYVRQKGEGLIS